MTQILLVAIILQTIGIFAKLIGCVWYFSISRDIQTHHRLSLRTYMAYGFGIYSIIAVLPALFFNTLWIFILYLWGGI